MVIQGAEAGGERLEGRLFFPNEIHSGGGIGDTLIGGLQVDVLHDGGGTAVLVGGDGGDTYHVSGTGDQVLDMGRLGIDQVIVADGDYTLPEGIEWLDLLDGVAGTGNAAANRLIGNDRANVLDGVAGTDGSSPDTLVGGAGDDTYIVHSAGDLVIEAPSQGHDVMVVAADFDSTDPLWDWDWTWARDLGNVEEVRFDSAWSTGARFFAYEIQMVRGTDHADSLGAGGAGGQTLVGLGGDDRYSVWLEPDTPLSAFPTIVELPDGGWDTLQSNVDCVLPDHVEVLHLVYGPGRKGTGNALDNLIQGGFGSDQLAGAAGDDTLVGGDGDDTYIGGAGDDLIDDSGEGLGTVQYDAARGQYEVVRQGDGWVEVRGPDGVDRLLGVETIRFADDEFVVDVPASGQLEAGSMVVNGVPQLVAQMTGLVDPEGVASVSYQWFDDSTPLGPAGDGVLVLDGITFPFPFYDLRAEATVVDLNGNTTTFVSDAVELPPVYEEWNWPFPTVRLVESNPSLEGHELHLTFNRALRVLDGDDWSRTTVEADGTTLVLFGTDERMRVEGSQVWIQLPPSIAPGMQVTLRSVGLFEPYTTFRLPVPDSTEPPGPRIDDSEHVNGIRALASEGHIGVSFEDLVVAGAGEIVLRRSDGEVVERYDVHDRNTNNLELTPAHLMLGLYPGLDPRYEYVLEWASGVLLDAQGRAGPDVSVPIVEFVRTYYLWSPAGESMVGGVHADNMYSRGPDTLQGGSGDDELHGDDALAVYLGPLHDYTVSQAASPYWGVKAWLVADGNAARDGTDLLVGVSRLRFADYLVDLGSAARAAALSPESVAILAELYVAFFDRIPEAAGIGFWLGELEAGATLESIADRFHAAGLQYGNFAANESSADFIERLYGNVLGRDADSGSAPTAAEIAYWQQQLDSGAHTRGTLVLQMLDDVHRLFENDEAYGWVERLLQHKGELAHWYAVERGLGKHTPQEDIAFGRELAALVTPEGIGAAIELVGVGDAQ